MMGFICNLTDGYYEYVSRFIPVCTSRPPDANNLIGVAIDARHGRALIRSSSAIMRSRNALRRSRRYDCDGTRVWDLTTDERWEVPPSPHAKLWRVPNEAVLCAATGSGACDHLDCHGGPFVVVSAVNTSMRELSLCIYSSEAGAWSEPTLFLTDCDYSLDEVPTALAENTLCFSTGNGSHALMYDLATDEAYFVDIPPSLMIRHRAIALMAMKDGGLGVAKLDEFARLSLWSLGVNPDIDMGMRWTQIRVIELDKLLPAKAHSICPAFVGFACDVGVFCVWTNDGIFTFDLMSGEVRKVCEEAHGLHGVTRVFPYMSFYTPALKDSE